MPNTDLIKKLKPTFTPKKWGGEVVIINNIEKGYCGKILHFNKDTKFSLHFHFKDECWYIVSGKYLLKYFDTSNANSLELELNVGDIIHVPPMQPHQIICIESGDIFEVSTPDYADDSYRIGKGDSQS